MLFSPLQGTLSASLLGKIPSEADSVVLYYRGKVYLRSAAVLKCTAIMGFPWSIMQVFLLVPTFLRDAFYRFVARNRIRWFGRSDTCWVMTDALKSRFV
jgi:predicted DCC family thiol-disulfide oxidoreductase YuxK